MTDWAIRVDNLGKKYTIRHQRQHQTLRHALTDGLRNLKRGRSHHPLAPTQEEFWALNNISFTIQQGDRVGIIGRNGAGKSTLLKLLSRITEPTTGRIHLRGRVASLLEVGTGFHPELTGRENIFLNGSILGMERQEILKKFDEIVAFAEVERFLDTPVKRYSSGMYVRLAFAVAAHLETEILIIDEVLAVGDAKFQEKCLGKMKNVQREGRTVIFVSHQMGMINQLCNHAFFLDNGILVEENIPSIIIQNYLNHIHQEQNNRFFKAKKNNQDIQIISAETASQSGQSKVQFSHDEDIILKINIYVLHPVENATIGVLLKDYKGRNIFTAQYNLENSQKQSTELQASMKIPGMFLRPGRYSFLAAVHVPNIREIDRVEEICSFMIFDIGSEFSIYSDQSDQGCVFANCQWNIHETPMTV